MGKLVHGSLPSGFGFQQTPLSSLEGFFCPISCPKARETINQIKRPRLFSWEKDSLSWLPCRRGRVKRSNRFINDNIIQKRRRESTLAKISCHTQSHFASDYTKRLGNGVGSESYLNGRKLIPSQSKASVGGWGSGDGD